MGTVERTRRIAAVIVAPVAVAACASAVFSADTHWAREDTALDRMAEATVRVVANTEASVTLRFEADDHSAEGTTSVLVRVPDTGAIESEVTGIEVARFEEPAPGSRSPFGRVDASAELGVDAYSDLHAGGQFNPRRHSL